MDEQKNQNLTGNNSKPTYLSSENPDALANPDIKTTTVSVTPDTESEFSNNSSVKPQDKITGMEINDPSIPPKPQETFVGRESKMESNAALDEYKAAISQPLPQTSYPPQAAFTPPQPIVTQKEIIYREGGGGSFLGNLFWQLFNCVGCLLFLISIAVIVVVFWINF